MAHALLIDLDGVVRQWPKDVPDLPGLSPDIIRAALFEPERLLRAVTGVISDDEWRLEAAASLLEARGVDCASSLVEAATYPGEVRADVLDLVRRARQAVPVCLISNGTSRLSDHLAQLSLVGQFDLVFNSSELGVAKPDPEIFRRACERLRLLPRDVLFVDDNEGHVLAASTCGIRSHHFTTPDSLQGFLSEEGVLGPS